MEHDPFDAPWVYCGQQAHYGACACMLSVGQYTIHVAGTAGAVTRNGSFGLLLTRQSNIHAMIQHEQNRRTKAFG